MQAITHDKDFILDVDEFYKMLEEDFREHWWEEFKTAFLEDWEGSNNG